jgi:thioredoxin-like negative regulator of GroEL
MYWAIAIVIISCQFAAAYVARLDLLPSVIEQAKLEKVTVLSIGTPSLATTMQAVEERDGFACINGSEAFNQKVVLASHARPVVVFFFAQRDFLSQSIWQQLLPLAQQQQDEKKQDFVAVDIFQNIDAEDNQNYQIAMKCVGTAGFEAIKLPVVVFFKDGLMCSSPQAILMGEVTPGMVRQIAEKLTAEKR